MIGNIHDLKNQWHLYKQTKGKNHSAFSFSNYFLKPKLHLYSIYQIF